jgi:hypothetical protein
MAAEGEENSANNIFMKRKVSYQLGNFDKEIAAGVAISFHVYKTLYLEYCKCGQGLVGVKNVAFCHYPLCTDRVSNFHEFC